MFKKIILFVCLFGFLSPVMADSADTYICDAYIMRPDAKDNLKVVSSTKQETALVISHKMTKIAIASREGKGICFPKLDKNTLLYNGDNCSFNKSTRFFLFEMPSGNYIGAHNCKFVGEHDDKQVN